jgi:hypothetical protein
MAPRKVKPDIVPPTLGTLLSRIRIHPDAPREVV